MHICMIPRAPCAMIPRNIWIIIIIERVMVGDKFISYYNKKFAYVYLQIFRQITGLSRGPFRYTEAKQEGQNGHCMVPSGGISIQLSCEFRVARKHEVRSCLVCVSYTSRARRSISKENK